MGGEVSRLSIRRELLSVQAKAAVHHFPKPYRRRFRLIDGLVPPGFRVVRYPSSSRGGLFSFNRPTELEHLDTLEALGVKLVVSLLPADFVESGTPGPARADSGLPPLPTDMVSFVYRSPHGQWVVLDPGFVPVLKCRFEHVHLPVKQDACPEPTAETLSVLRRVKATIEAGGSVGVHDWDSAGPASIFAASALALSGATRHKTLFGALVLAACSTIKSQCSRLAPLRCASSKAGSCR